MKNHQNKTNLSSNTIITPISILSVSILATTLAILSGSLTNTTHATGVTDEINVTIPASCSLTSVVGSAHTSTIETGVYQDDIGETTFKVFCNDSEGFAVYAVGYTNDSFGNNTLKPTNLASSYAIATGTATSGDTSNWAMKLTAVTGTYAPTIHSTEENSNTYSFTSYHTIPSEYTKVASYSSNTDATTGSSFKSTYAVYASPTQPADSYTGKVKYTVVHPANADTPLSKTINDLTYMQDFNSLSAVERAAVTSSMQYNTTYSLIDNRDNKTYQIARLKDDNIWMAENLDLGRTTLATDLTSANTNLHANATTITAPTFNGWVKTSGTPSFTSAELIPVTGSDSTSNTPYGTLYNYCAASAGTICSAEKSNIDNATSDLCPAGWRLPTGSATGEYQALIDLTDYNTSAKMRAPITNGGAAFALAGDFYYSTPGNQGSNGSYWSSTRYDNNVMYNLYLGASWADASGGPYRESGKSVRCVAKRPLHTLTVSYDTGISSVQINGSTIQNGGTIKLEEDFPYLISMTPSAGYYAYWSATSGSIDYADNWTTAYIAGNSDATLTANASYVATEMQNLSSNNCTTTASHARDNRDNHVYTIQRLADGKCWMMENLDLGRTELTTNLTSSNTNLSTTVTASTFNSWRKTAGSDSYTSAELIPLTKSNTENGLDTDPTSKTPYGTLYNYCAASAGTICAESNANNDNATSDICPAGWRLPTGGDSGELKLYLLTDYADTKLRAPITNGGAAFALAGIFYHSTYSPIDQQNEIGYYWSSTKSMYDGSSMSLLYINTSSTYTGTNSLGRYYGCSIRCITDI